MGVSLSFLQYAPGRNNLLLRVVAALVRCPGEDDPTHTSAMQIADCEDSGAV